MNDPAGPRLRANLAAVLERIAEACRRAGRGPGDVRLVGVTKYVPAELAAALAAAGCHDLAESRPQALWEKAAALAGLDPPPRWHLVGHLQRNKVRRTIGFVTLLHSLDSRRLLAALDAEAAAAGRPCDALVEVNIAGDPGRTGLPEADVAGFLAAAAGCRNVRVRGLMGMAAAPTGANAADAARRQFARLRELRDRLRGEVAPDVSLDELSMGMSGDFAEGILEGATLVRVGSALWEGVA
ncbi:MAG: YggS family pyridoxal phosphate-dependent enzyme [Planctomycetia bacterium]|nr:YggS family pyridoxal phosphate-dependent enzyme [Planctomycetia bacterium]